MNSRIMTIFLAVAVAIAGALLTQRLNVFHHPGIHTGYEPDQPINFSHRLHAGELNISCNYCHYGTTRSRYAGIPPAGVCMNCHLRVSAPWGAVLAENRAADKEGRSPRLLVSPEIQKIYNAVGRSSPGIDTLRSAGDVDTSGTPLEWTKVHNLADFVWFDHRPHIAAGVTCQKCHGPVETMERVRQAAPFNMGWCVNCHRQSTRDGVLGKPVRAPTDCAACHF